MTGAAGNSFRKTVIVSASLIALASSPARASFHLWAFNELFSNADGTVQFIELFTAAVGQQFASGETFRATQGAQVHDYVFPSNTPAPTNNHHLLLATAGFAALPGAPAPDFIMPDGFLFTPNGSLQNMAILGPTITYASLPTDGITSLAGDGVTTGVNSPTNYAGDTGQIDVSATVASPFLMWAQTLDDGIAVANLDGTVPTPVLSFPQSNGVVDVAVDPIAGLVYWGQVFEDRIQRANLDGTGVETVVAFPDADGITSVAIDEVARKLYWAQTFDDRIMRSNLNGTNIEVLLQFPQVAEVVALAIDTAGGKLYWAEAFDDTIRRSNLDGSVIEDLAFFPDVTGVVDIAIDPAVNTLYWAQTFNSRIRTVPMTGGAVSTLLEAPVTNDLAALAVEPSIGKLYWAQRIDDQLRRANVTGANVETILEWPTVDDPVALTMGSVQEGGNPVGACCEPAGTCVDAQIDVDCVAAGGTFQGDGSLCATVDCSVQLGACCLSDASCLETSEVDCALNPGASWAGASSVCPDACLTTTAPPPCQTVPGAEGNRYVRAECSATGVLEVLRVTIIALDGFGTPAPDYLYVGPPFQAPEEDSTQPGLTFAAAPLQCAPYFHNWSAEGTISMYGAEIMPGSVYRLQRANETCIDLADETCWSNSILLTTGTFGDVWPLFDAPGNPAQPDFNDIAALVRKFLGSHDAPIKAVSQLQPNVVFPGRAVDFRDIAMGVTAFIGTPTYAGSTAGPCTCPSGVTCGVTACTNDLPCGAGLCVGGFCADACGRCAP